MLSALKREGLASGLSAGCTSFYGCCSTFTVQVTLTEKGLKAGANGGVARVGELLFRCYYRAVVVHFHT